MLPSRTQFVARMCLVVLGFACCQLFAFSVSGLWPASGRAASAGEEASRAPSRGSDSPEAAAVCDTSDADTRNAVDSITASELIDHVRNLADDQFAGREAGTPGGQASSEYIVTQLRDMCLRPAGPDKEYFQPFGKGYRNILAMIEGSDPTVASEVIVVGAHYDHVGYGSRKAAGSPADICNGADDNASGVAAVLEIAEAMNHLAQSPRRSLLFAFWDAEEKGLLGSRHWVANPTVPIEHVAGVINLDMVGRLREDHLIVWGTGSAMGLRELVARHNTTSKLHVEFRPYILSKSDHYSLFVKGIPVLFPTTGLHPQLHRPDDETSLINAEGMQRVTQFVQRIAYDVAVRPDRLRFREASRGEVEGNPAKTAELPLPRPNDESFPFGFTCRREASEPNVRIVVKVAADTPAALAGLSPADRICQVAGTPATESLDLARVLADSPGPVPVVVERDGQFLTLSLDAARGSLKAPGVLDPAGKQHAWSTAPLAPLELPATTTQTPVNHAVVLGSTVLLEQGNGFQRIAFSPDERWLVATQFGQSYSLNLWDLTPEQPVSTRLHTEAQRRCESLRFSPDGRWLVLMDQDTGSNRSTTGSRTLKLIDLSRPPTAATLLQLNEPSTSSWWQPDGSGRWFGTYSAESLWLWDLALENPLAVSTRIHIPTRDRRLRPSLVSLSNNARWLIAGEYLVDLEARRGQDSEVTACIEEGPPLTASSSNDRWALGGSRLFDLSAPQPSATAVRLPLTKDENCATFSPDGRWLLVGTNGKMKLWDVAGKEPATNVREITGPGGGNIAWPFGRVQPLFSQDGRWLCVSADDGVARLIDLTVASLADVTVSEEKTAKHLLFSPDSRWLVVGDQAHVQLWDLWSMATGASSRELLKFPDQKGLRYPLLSPNGRWLTIVHESQPVVWDLQADDPALSSVRLPGAQSRSAAFSPDSRWLFTDSSEDSTSREDRDCSTCGHLWDLTCTSVETSQVTLEGHHGRLRVAGFSPQGNWLAVAGSRETRLWSMKAIAGRDSPPAYRPAARSSSRTSMNATFVRKRVLLPAAFARKPPTARN